MPSIGRGGIEALAEPILRGQRGRVLRTEGEEKPLETVEAVSGRDVNVTIDIELQASIAKLFKDVFMKDADGRFQNIGEMLGAAVVLDVPTGEVRALVSNPTYDLNTFDQEYARLSADDFRRPFLNRATQMALEPGSTVKPMVGM